MMMVKQVMELMMGGSKCQDCGNQAKKDCVHRRCRTCCKSKGFQCQTHIKSTWIPVYRRRQKEQHHPSFTIHQQHLQGRNPKRHRSYGWQDIDFPAEMNSMAMFHCVRVQSMMNLVDEHAYQTAVKVGGHIFKGILYDQGPEKRDYAVGESSSSAHHHQQQHNLINVTALAISSTSTIAAESTVPPIYPICLNAFMPETQHFSHTKS